MSELLTTSVERSEPPPCVDPWRPRPRALPVPDRRPRRETVEVRLALDDATRDDAYALRHESYAASGHIDPRPDRRFSDEYDALPSTRTLVAYESGRPIGSVRACFLSRRHGWRAPCRDSFPDAVDALLASCPDRDSGAVAIDGIGAVDAIEVTRLVRAPDVVTDQAMVFLLYRLAGWFAVRHDASMALSCVRQNHIGFYRRLRFTEIGSARAYPGLRCPMHLMACPRPDYDRSRRSIPGMDPEAFGPAAFAGLLEGRTIPMTLRR